MLVEHQSNIIEATVLTLGIDQGRGYGGRHAPAMHERCDCKSPRPNVLSPSLWCSYRQGHVATCQGRSYMQLPMWLRQNYPIREAQYANETARHAPDPRFSVPPCAGFLHDLTK